MIRKGYRYLLTAVIAASAAALLTFAARNDFGLGRNMEITVNMMRELSLGYVDPIDPDRLMEGAAAGMVSDLDPYTEYISEEGMSDFEAGDYLVYNDENRTDGYAIKPGKFAGKDLTVVSVFEAVGEHGAGRLSDADFLQIERRACPGKGSRRGMYTANTMSSAFEALGMSLPGSSTMAAEHLEKAASGRARRR